MIRKITVLSSFALVVFFMTKAHALEPVSAAELQAGSGLETSDPESLARTMDVIVLPELDGANPNWSIAPAMRAELEPSDEVWMNVDQSSMVFDLTGRISLGLDYDAEETGGLPEDRIDTSISGGDDTSHELVVRARWRFDTTH